ncbi:MAG TPA: extracellular solute-binding protein [Longimicrobiaceae bacterium]|nr:extracellular solute-binding protein [Longimicrobiaceae bacterium]
MPKPALKIILAALTLAACSSGGDNGRETLTIYSPHGEEMLDVFEKLYEQSHPGVDVQTVDMGSQEVLDRLRSERANPQADVWWGAPAPTFEDAARDSLLERFVPTWAGALPPEAKSAQGLWHGTYLTPEVIAYNTEAVPSTEVPRDWDEVLDPKWRGKVLIRDPMASGTMRTIFGMVIHRSIRATGDTAQGFEWLRRLDAQTKEYVLNPTMLYQKLARREGVVTLWDMPDIETLKAKTKFPIDYVIPRSGTPLLVDAVAVVRGAPNPERAREFVEWVGETETVVRAARESFRLPARTDIPEDSLPEGLRRARREIRPEPLDWTLLQQKTPEWMRYWDEHVRGKGAGR